MTEYRDLRLDDIDHMMQMSGRFFDGSPTYRHISRDDNKLRMLFEQAIFVPDSYFCKVAVVDGVIVGGMLGLACEYFFSTEKTACDIAIFIEPEFRKSRIAVKLVDSFRQWATDVGCREITIGATTQSHGDGYERLLNRMGFETVGFVTKQQIER